MDDPQGVLNTLPTGQAVTYSHQKSHDVCVLLVMPAGLQRKMVATELLSCGFRVLRAYDCVEALSVAVDIKSEIIFINNDMTPFSGRELSNVLAAVDSLHDTHVVLLTSHDQSDAQLQGLPANVSVVQKNSDFTDTVGELMIDWGVFGAISQASAKAGTG